MAHQNADGSGERPATGAGTIDSTAAADVPPIDAHIGDSTVMSDGAHAVHPLWQSLVRPHLYLGVERLVISLEATACAALLIGVGPSTATIGLTALVVLVVHPVMAWLTARDAMTVEAYARSRRYADFYAPHAHAAARTPAPRASVPAAH